MAVLFSVLLVVALAMTASLSGAVEMGKLKLRHGSSLHRADPPNCDVPEPAPATTGPPPYIPPWGAQPPLFTQQEWEAAIAGAWGAPMVERARSAIALHPRPQAHMRAMSLATLIRVRDFVARIAANGGVQVNVRGKGLTRVPAEQVNMYNINEILVKPATAGKGISFAELVQGAYPPTYFVSHFWGGSFFKFVNALIAHKQQFEASAPDDNVFYWVCTFANNQHDASDELGGVFPDSSPFYMAIAHTTTKGVVSVQEDSLAAEKLTLSRIWCVFEMQIAKQLNKPVVFACESGALLGTTGYITPNKQCSPDFLSRLKGFTAEAANVSPGYGCDKIKILEYINSHSQCPATGGTQCLNQLMSSFVPTTASVQPAPAVAPVVPDEQRPIETLYRRSLSRTLTK